MAGQVMAGPFFSYSFAQLGATKGKNFHEFCSFVAIHKGFLRKIWRRGILWRGKTKQSAKVSPQKSPIHERFLPRKFPALRYYMYMYVYLVCALVPRQNSGRSYVVVVV